MLAKETDQPFNDPQWLFEIKWDGYRAIAEIHNKKIQLYSRKGNSFLTSYPTIVNELKKMNIDAVLDGEIVVLDENGLPNFQKLQNYENNAAYPLCYYVFDILKFNKINTCDLPLIERKKLLKKILPENPVIKYSDHIIEQGVSFFKLVKSKNIEGVIAKKTNSLYLSGVRTNEWLKIKHHKTEEVIIAGFTNPKGSRKYFGALILGMWANKQLKYVGHTGSGFNEKLLHEIYERLQPLIQDHSAFKERIKTNAPVTWVQPKLICEVTFSEWTEDKKMRHPIFLHMRNDKYINEINMKNYVKPSQKENNEKYISFGRTKVKTTNLNKVFWPEEGITKGMVIDYYLQMAAYILPYLKNRPESLKRNPNGMLDQGFFHKDAGDEAPSWVKTFSIFSESTKKEIDYIICNNKATLTYLNNLGCIELNPWNSTINSIDKPDYLIIDIDPSKKNTFEHVIEVTNAFKAFLDKAKARSFCKTSGATGMHVYIPMGKKYDYEQVRNFAEFLCIQVNEELPRLTSMERNLQKRGNNKIYLDYLQNRKGQTVASVYSLRPHPGATVSTPLEWNEVKSGLHPTDFNIHTILQRIEKKGDIFSDLLATGIDLNDCLEKLS